jgi:hypothetical protein
VSDQPRYQPGPAAPIQWPSGHPFNPVHVRVTDVQLSMGSVFRLILQFTFAFIVIDAVVLIVLAIVIGALVN